MHVSSELFEGNLGLILVLDVLHDLVYIFLLQQLAFPLETLNQGLCCDEAFSALFKMMERKQKIMLRNGLSAVDTDREKLTVVDLAVVAIVNVFEQRFHFLVAHVCVFECEFKVVHLEGAGLVQIQVAESAPQEFKVEFRRLGLIG